jgi:hypothetical protein
VPSQTDKVFCGTVNPAKEIETVTTDIATIPVAEGEVVNTAEGSADQKKAYLKTQETIIRKNWKAVTEKANVVYRALTEIHTYNLWKLHLDDKGKRKYTNFETYLKDEFGWEMSRPRALQIIKATRADMIAAGDMPASAAAPRTRTAPEVTSERAAKVTADQLSKVWEAFVGRVDSITEGDPDKGAVVRVLDDLRSPVALAIADLREIAAAAEAAADTSDADEDDDDDEDDDEDDES